MGQLPSHQQLTRRAEKQLEKMDHRTLQMGHKRIFRKLKKRARKVTLHLNTFSTF